MFCSNLLVWMIFYFYDELSIGGDCMGAREETVNCASAFVWSHWSSHLFSGLCRVPDPCFWIPRSHRNCLGFVAFFIHPPTVWSQRPPSSHQYQWTNRKYFRNIFDDKLPNAYIVQTTYWRFIECNNCSGFLLTFWDDVFEWIQPEVLQFSGRYSYLLWNMAAPMVY